VPVYPRQRFNAEIWPQYEKDTNGRYYGGNGKNELSERQPEKNGFGVIPDLAIYFDLHLHLQVRHPASAIVLYISG
jgi:hypothetical protein